MKTVHAQLLGTIFGLLVIILFLLLQGCVGLPTLEATSTPQGNETVTLPANTPISVGSVTITGNVYIRDSVGNDRGWLTAGSKVLAVCTGDWCALVDSPGLKFYRGCSDDNPKNLACRSRK